MNRKRFYNLDGLRFFAALIVLLGHIEVIKTRVNSFPPPGNDFLMNAAPISVTFFFVLSGFLIAYLLMLEQQENKNQTRKINITRFYKKRILRIWPLYYVLVLLAFFVFPYFSLFNYPGYTPVFADHQYKGLLLFSAFFPNLSEFVNGNILYLGQTWSLGVEEFFYLFFPLGLYFLSLKKSGKYFIALILSSLAISAIAKIWCNANDPNLPLSCIYISRYRIYAFASGAFSAYVFLSMRESDFIFRYNKQLKIISYIIFFGTIALLIADINFSSFTHPLFAFIFAVLILLLTISNIKIGILNHKIIVYLGKISYGIYMLHPLAIVICLKLFDINFENNFLNVLTFDIISVATVIILSALSYAFLERPFLKMRN
jgi:peptidoglycan/LPS O-acetylase OafA/YrhL